MSVSAGVQLHATCISEFQPRCRLGGFCHARGRPLSSLDIRTGAHMALPQRAFFTLHETASRWGCTIADIGGWATEGKLDIVTGISLAICGDEKVSGKITISPMDMLPLFRRAGTGPTVINLLRIKPEHSQDWWTCHTFVPLRLLTYAAFASKAKGLFQPSAE